jgi:hypothetical protein
MGEECKFHHNHKRNLIRMCSTKNTIGFVGGNPKGSCRRRLLLSSSSHHHHHHDHRSVLLLLLLP